MTADELVAQLDQRGEPWDLYRGGGDHNGKVWVVCLGLGVDTRDSRDDVRRFCAPSLFEALQLAATAGPPLPGIPRRPWVPVRSDFSVQKTGSKWGLDCEGRPFLGNFATRKAAWEHAEAIVARHKRAAAEWDATHGIWLVGRTEDVDFRWAS